MNAVQPMILLRAEANTAAQASRADGAEMDGVEFYRRHTETLLRRYLQTSMQMGRMPSVLGMRVFRGRSSSSRMRNFEDAVVFVIDVERCLKRLDTSAQVLLLRIALQEYTQAEAAELTGQSLRSVIRKYGTALDRLTVFLLKDELLDTLPSVECQAPRRRCSGASARHCRS